MYHDERAHREKVIDFQDQMKAQEAAMGKQPLAMMTQVVLLWVGAVALLGKWVGDALSLTFDQAIWLILASLVGLGVAFRAMRKRQEAQAYAEYQQTQAERLGFSTFEGYERSAAQRRERTGVAVHDALVSELHEQGGYSNIVSFEERFSKLGMRRNVDVSLENQDFSRSAAFSILGQFKKRLIAGRSYILFRTCGAGLLCAFGMWLGLASMGLSNSVMGTVFTGPIWGGWAFLASLFSLATAVLTVVIKTLDSVATHLKQICAKALRSALVGVSSKTGDRIQLSELPAVLRRWRASALGSSTERGILARSALMLGNRLTKGIEKRVSKSLLKEAGATEGGSLSAGKLEEAIASGAVSVLSGPFPRQLRLLRTLAQGGLTFFVLCSITLAWIM